MTFDEYIEKSFPEPFNSVQKNLEFKYPEAERKIGMKERRCSCGRLLGRFNGQAEVKCPKCGKMNLIGVVNREHNKDSGCKIPETDNRS